MDKVETKWDTTRGHTLKSFFKSCSGIEVSLLENVNILPELFHVWILSVCSKIARNLGHFNPPFSFPIQCLIISKKRPLICIYACDIIAEWRNAFLGKPRWSRELSPAENAWYEAYDTNFPDIIWYSKNRVTIFPMGNGESKSVRFQWSGSRY